MQPNDYQVRLERTPKGWFIVSPEPNGDGEERTPLDAWDLKFTLEGHAYRLKGTRNPKGASDV